MVAPREACENLQRLATEGREGRLRLLRSGGLYAVASAARRDRASTIRSFMAHHQGMSLLALANLLRTGRCSGASWPVRCSRRPTCCCRSGCRRPPRTCFSEDLESEAARKLAGERRKRRCACSPILTPPAPEVHLLVQWPLPCRDQQRRRRLQPLAGSGGHPLARRRHARLLGNVLLSARRGDRRILVDRLSTDSASDRSATRPSSPRRARSSASATPDLKSTPRSASRRKTTSSCGASRSPTIRRSRAHRTDQLRRSRAGRRRRRTRRIPRSAICLCKPNSSRNRSGHSLHPPAALRGRKAAVAAPSDGGPGRRAGRYFL